MPRNERLYRTQQIQKLVAKDAETPFEIATQDISEFLASLDHSLTELRSRSLLRYFTTTCRNFEVRALQALPPLPPFRVKELPFSFTGVDFTGSFYIGNSESTSSKV